MTSKTLLVSGCSYTESGGCNTVTPKELSEGIRSWGDHLAERLGMNCTNLARAGWSNQTIFKSVVEHLHSSRVDAVVVMWSEFERLAVLRSKKKRRYVTQQLHICQKNGDHTDFSKIRNADVLEWNETHDKMHDAFTDLKLWPREACIDEFFFTAHLFTMLMKTYEIPYLQCFGPNVVGRGEPEDRDLSELDAEVGEYMLKNRYFDSLDDPRFVGYPGMNSIGGYCMDEILRENHRISEDDMHPNDEGHKVFAKKLYEEYVKIYGK